MIDLHLHSAASDGSQQPQEIVLECHRLGLELNAITDHDNIDAQVAALETSRRLGRPYLTGIEISVQHIGELHILGYGMDLHNAAFQSMMESLRASRVERVECILSRLKKEGIDVTLTDVQQFAGSATLGRPHVAQALAQKGYAQDYHEAFRRFLDQGGLCYVQRRLLDSRQAIELIRDARGVPVVAHPGLITTDNLPALVRKLREEGLQGIEAFYPAHSDEQVEAYCLLASELDLLVTCGSDCHGIYRDRTIGTEKRTNQQLLDSTLYLKNLAV